MAKETAGRVGAGSAIGGSIVLLIGTYLHPLGADPNDTLAAFTEYAADRLWVTSHLMQLAGVSAIVVALVCLARQLASSREPWAEIGAAGTIAALAIAAALQAVDGVALKRMVDAWAVAPAESRDAAFRAAFAVRQVEIGLAAMLNLVIGGTASVFGLALLGDDRFPRWTAVLALAGGVPTIIAGVVMAYTGFSELAMDIGMPANVLLLTWMLAIGAVMGRGHAS